MFHITMLAVPHLVKTKGSIVNVSSVNGMRSVSVEMKEKFLAALRNDKCQWKVKYYLLLKTYQIYFA